MLLPTLLLIAACSLHLQASPPAREKASGSVTGHVFYADTNTPARLASVLLQPVATATTAAATPEMEPSIEIASVQTSIDGRFSFYHVAPGTYYVLASSPGYMSALVSLGLASGDLLPDSKPVSSESTQSAQGATSKTALLARLPKVTVQANLSAVLDVSLERGAAVSGTVLYDDGSPASGLGLNLLALKKAEWKPLEFDAAPMAATAKTNDRGGYRLAGLPPGEYLVEVSLSIESTLYQRRGQFGAATSHVGLPYSVPVYSGSAFRTRDAVSFVVKAGDERMGEDIRIPLAKLHSVSGTILAARDGHTVNGGSVLLLYADDKSQAAQVRLTRDQPGFSFSFVAEGDYLVRAEGAGDFEYEEVANPPGSFPATYIKENPSHWYGKADQPVHVQGEVSGLTVAVPEKPSKPPAAQ